MSNNIATQETRITIPSDGSQVETCGICFDTLTNPGRLACPGAHTFCFDCAVETLRRTPVCPMCRAEVTSITKDNTLYLVRPLPNTFTPMTLAAENSEALTRARRHCKFPQRALNEAYNVFIFACIGMPVEVGVKVAFGWIFRVSVFLLLLWGFVTACSPYPALLDVCCLSYAVCAFHWRRWRRSGVEPLGARAKLDYDVMMLLFVVVDLCCCYFSNISIEHPQRERLFRWLQWGTRAAWVGGQFLRSFFAVRHTALTKKFERNPAYLRSHMWTMDDSHDNDEDNEVQPAAEEVETRMRRLRAETTMANQLA